MEDDNDVFEGFANDPLRALLLWYLNSGVERFGALRDNATDSMGSEQIMKEVEGEILSHKEMATLIETYFAKRKFAEGEFYACGACGIRDNDMLYSKNEINLQDLCNYPSMCYSDSENEDYLQQKDADPLVVPTEVPGGMKEIHLWKAVSMYESSVSPACWFHLHGELVTCHQSKQQDGTYRVDHETV